jgi:hypothetical protein
MTLSERQSQPPLLLLHASNRIHPLQALHREVQQEHLGLQAFSRAPANAAALGKRKLTPITAVLFWLPTAVAALPAALY